MKLASFIHKGTPSYGIVSGEEIIDVGGALRSRAYPTLKSLLPHTSSFEKLLHAPGAPRLPLSVVEFAPVIPDPARILCIGINYAAHGAEAGRKPPEKPMVFVRFPDSQTGHRQPMVKPAESDMFDYEGELAVIIGRGGRRIAPSAALSHVGGYACYNDGSVRDWQRHSTQFTAGKTFPSTGGFGPWMVTSDEIPDPSKLRVTTRLNGKVMQQAPTSDMVFDVPTLIAYCSTFTNLEVGDVIITGTPEGVGAFRNPPVWMKDGDVVEVEITGIGILRNPVRAEKLSG